MKRKIIKQGAATLTISLPAKWAKKFDLKQGDEVSVEESNGNLLLSAGELKKKPRSVTIEIEQKDDKIPMLTHLYRNGMDTIKVKELIDEVPKITSELLLGFEVTERGKDYIVISMISEPTENKYDVLLRRVFLMIKEAQELTGEGLKDKFSRLDALELLKKQHDKFVLFCKRSINLQKGSAEQWELLTFLMHIMHSYYYFYKYCSEEKVKPTVKIKELLQKLQQYYGIYYDAYYKEKFEGVHKINRLKKKYQFGKCYSYVGKAKGKEAVALALLRELFRIIQIGSSPILSRHVQALLAEPLHTTAQ